MKTPPAAVAPTTTPVADIAACNPQTRLPRANPQSPNRGHSNEYRFLTPQNRPSQPGRRSHPTDTAAAKRALPIETANTDATTPTRASRRVTPEPAHPHRNLRSTVMSLVTTQEALDTWNDVSEAGKARL